MLKTGDGSEPGPGGDDQKKLSQAALDNRSRRSAPSQPVMSIADTCKKTTLSRSKIYALVRESKLKVCRVGRRTLVYSESVDDLLGL
jgi:excisionase family DNA binding protein